MLCRHYIKYSHSFAQLLLGWNNTRALFPSAALYMSTWENFTAELVKHKDLLPVMTKEIGDTWIYVSAAV